MSSAIMTKEELRADVAYWQRLLKFHGYDCGKVDGIRGKNTRHAEELWDADAERSKRYGVFDERTEGNLATVAPRVQELIRMWLTKAKEAAAQLQYEVKIIEGTRSYARQNALYRQGGVTKARGGRSWHNFGLACDMGVFRGKAYITDDSPYIKFGKLAETVPGLEWGGSWKSFKDYPHMQMAKYASTTAARNAFEAIS